MNDKPEYPKQMERFLREPKFLKEHGINICKKSNERLLQKIVFSDSLFCLFAF
jgi:hypothetical protein